MNTIELPKAPHMYSWKNSGPDLQHIASKNRKKFLCSYVGLGWIWVRLFSAGNHKGQPLPWDESVKTCSSGGRKLYPGCFCFWLEETWVAVTHKASPQSCFESAFRPTVLPQDKHFLAITGKVPGTLETVLLYHLVVTYLETMISFRIS